MPLHLLAQAANEALRTDNPAVLAMLSRVGKRFYFPAKGILAQAGEAKAQAKRYNATIGIATDEKGPVHLACVDRYFHNLAPSDIYVYAPSQGRPDLRAAWAEKQRAETPSLGSHTTSLPVVTNALTHGLSVVGDLFIDDGDTVLVPELMWENYPLCWETRLGAHLDTWQLFNREMTGLNVEGFKTALRRHAGDKIVVALNFPNNPTGYQPTRTEGEAMVQALRDTAAAGSRIVAICDDAYYGMFFHEDCETESLFGRLAQAHPNLLAVKVDGATKEEFVWGLRVGFLTYGIAGGTPALYKALEDKTAGLIRATISNVSMPGQSIVLKALQDPEFRTQQAEKVAVLRERAAVAQVESRKKEYADCWDVYPFNAGYFMCLRIKGVNADVLRRHLLSDHALGTIALGESDLRVAFSCLLASQVPDVYARIAQGVRALRG